MKKLFALILIGFWIQTISLAQETFTTINLDLIRSQLNGGMPIPSEEKFYVRGAIPSQIELVKLTIYPSKKSPKAGYTYFWKVPFGYQELAFQILVEEPLRANQDYHLDFGFYQKAGYQEVEEVRELIHDNLSTYLSTITTIKRGGIKFEDSDEQILANMTRILEAGAYYFELPQAQKFPGFSDLTRNKLEQRKKLKMGKAKFNATGVEEGDNARAVYARQYLDELEQIIFSEVDQYLSTNLLARVDQKIFQTYPTEKKSNSIPLNVGYGAISLKQGLSQQEFVTGPYAGVSFPLGNRTFTKFMSNLSLSSGFFLSGNMENSLNEQIGGPLLDRPLYVGLGYNFFRIVRLNAGGTFITTRNQNGGKTDYFTPFVGLSLEFKLWLGFGNKR